MIGTVISHYRIVEKIGEGGMGEVYRAEDLRLPRSVAVKILPERALQSRERRERFVREARAASSLNHPGIVHVYDVDEAEGRLFIAMEYVAGRTLADVLAERPMPVAEILRIAIEAGEALRAAHVHGIVHRDIKPSNIIVADEGFVKILDFGLAKLLDPSAESLPPDEASTRAPNLTRHGQLIGTVLYMSPELALGEDVDPRSDIFSFGAVLYEMATGRLPFTGATEVAILDRILHGSPPPLRQEAPEAPEALERIIRKAMARRREDRYPAVDALLADLRRLRRELEAGVATGASAASGRWLPPAEEPLRLRRTLLWGGLAVALAVATGVALDRRSDRPAPSGERPGRSLAILPLENGDADPEARYFSDGVTEAILVDLSRIEGLTVVAPAASALRQGSDPIEIGRRLGVEHVLGGTVRRQEGNVRIAAWLRSVREAGRVVWAERYDRPMTGIFQLQDRVAQEIAGALQIRLSSGERAMIERVPTANLRAYDYYLRGRELAARRESLDLRRAVEMFEKARDLDPNYAPAYAGLADALAVALMYGWEIGEDLRSGADAASRQAIALDPTLPEAHLSRGVVAALEGDLEGGYSRVLHAVSLAPDSARAHHWLAVLAKLRGDYGQAREEDLAALRLDPDLGVAHLNLAHVAILDGRPGEAAATMEALLAERSDLPLARVLLGWALLRAGDPRGALRTLEIAAAMAPADPLVAGMQGMALAAAGDAAGARRAASRAESLAQARPVPLADYSIACVRARLGDTDGALLFLERALGARSLGLSTIITPAYVGDDPDLAPLRGDRRFAALLGSFR